MYVVRALYARPFPRRYVEIPAVKNRLSEDFVVPLLRLIRIARTCDVEDFISTLFLATVQKLVSPTQVLAE